MWQWWGQWWWREAIKMRQRRQWREKNRNVMVVVIEGKEQRCGDSGGGGEKTIEMWWRLHAVEGKKQNVEEANSEEVSKIVFRASKSNFSLVVIYMHDLTLSQRRLCAYPFENMNRSMNTSQSNRPRNDQKKLSSGLYHLKIAHDLILTRFHHISFMR